MQQFYADFIVKFLSELSAWEVLAGKEKRDTPANPLINVGLYAKIGVLQGLCFMYSLNASDQQCRRMMETFETKKMNLTCGEVRDDLRELRRRFEDDFKPTFFLQLTAKEAEQFQNPLKDDWESIGSRFSKVRFNIEESMKCFALQRYAAAVFHILQVTEYGVIKVADLLEVSEDKPGWGSLQRLADLISVPHQKRTELAKKHSKLLEGVVPLAMIFKNSWRHKLDHVDNQIVWHETDFSPTAAEEIIMAARAFMRKLALELPYAKAAKKS
ncbi:MAG TPA: hypothetical protein VGT08_00170 [Terracidiphilus sp.]|nr:hypothetical protein [Terracidiphilus sp.]